LGKFNPQSTGKRTSPTTQITTGVVPGKREAMLSVESTHQLGAGNGEMP
jgi:hypothetical protein